MIELPPASAAHSSKPVGILTGIAVETGQELRLALMTWNNLLSFNVVQDESLGRASATISALILRSGPARTFVECTATTRDASRRMRDTFGVSTTRRKTQAQRPYVCGDAECVSHPSSFDKLRTRPVTAVLPHGA
jgi:hypothetical protein